MEDNRGVLPRAADEAPPWCAAAPAGRPPPTASGYGRRWPVELLRLIVSGP
jgi:hypothetical protein